MKTSRALLVLIDRKKSSGGGRYGSEVVEKHDYFLDNFYEDTDNSMDLTLNMQNHYLKAHNYQSPANLNHLERTNNQNSCPAETVIDKLDELKELVYNINVELVRFEQPGVFPTEDDLKLINDTIEYVRTELKKYDGLKFPSDSMSKLKYDKSLVDLKKSFYDVESAYTSQINDCQSPPTHKNNLTQLFTNNIADVSILMANTEYEICELEKKLKETENNFKLQGSQLKISEEIALAHGIELIGLKSASFKSSGSFF
jgi:hypothetical protein